MKIDIKKILCNSIMALMVIPFFLINSVPVNAAYEDNRITINDNQVFAYQYWNLMGFDLVDTTNFDTTTTVSSQTGAIGNTGYTLICDEPSYTGDGYACFYRNNSSGQISGTWQQLSIQSYTETEHNTVVNGVRTPWLSGTYTHPTGYQWSKSFRVHGNGESVYMAFAVDNNLYDSSIDYTEYCLIWSSTNQWIDFEVVNRIEGYHYYYYVFKFTNNNPMENNVYQADVTVDFPKITSNTKLIPIYLGNGSDLNDLEKQQLFIETKTEKYLSKIENNTAAVIEGNSTSQIVQQNLVSQNQQLNTSVNQINTIESTYNNDLNTALNDIDISTDLVQHTGFTNAALWVAAQFNRLVIGTPLELVVTFSLITGLALVLIGKVRG